MREVHNQIQYDSATKLHHSGDIQKILYVMLKCKRGSSWIITLYSLTVFVNKKLSKVPLNVIAEDSPFAFLQELIQRRSILSVYFNLVENGEFRFEASTNKVSNLVISSRFLVTKLVTRKC
jgi:hypothetical protein